jgi:hypothetical protein
MEKSLTKRILELPLKRKLELLLVFIILYPYFLYQTLTDWRKK